MAQLFGCAMILKNRFMSKQLKWTALLLFLIGLPFWGKAQNSDDAKDVTHTYLIKGATVVQKPGMVLSNASVLVKDGLIQNVGKKITPPFDAMVIDADSMFVYAAFIDAATHAGITKEEKKDRPKVTDPGNPPNDIAGVTPQVKAAEVIDFKNSAIKEMRKQGFGYLHVLPRGRMLPGSGAVISTGEGSPDERLIAEKTAMYSQLKSARGVFPNTVIGVMSKYRDVFKNAKLNQNYRTVYKTNPKGIARPKSTKEYSAMGAVVSGKMPVFFRAEKARDVFKILTLKDELGFDLVLTDVRQANLLVDKLRGKSIPLVLSLNLPKKMEDNKKDKKEDKEPVDPAKEAFEKRKKMSYDKYESQAADLAKANIDFAFSTLSAKPKDIKPNVLRMVEKGLSADDALAALTVNPAKMLGLSAIMGTIESGKLGNLVITDKSYFDEKSKIKYTLIDGKLTKSKEKKKSKSKGESTSDIMGKWSYELEIPGQSQSGTIIIEKDGDEYSIKLDSADEPGDYEEATDVEVSGDDVSFNLKIENEGMTMDISSTMTISGDDFEGTMSIAQFGSFPMKGSKISPEK